MRSFVIAAMLWSASTTATATPLTAADRAELRQLPNRLVQGWLHNSEREVMGIFAPDAVFIPHDGVRPHIGRTAMKKFWFPPGGGTGTVTAFAKSVDGLSGDTNHAVVWGKSDLHWQDKVTAYNWLGYYLMVAERRGGKWLVTYIMSSDKPPTTQPVKTP